MRFLRPDGVGWSRRSVTAVRRVLRPIARNPFASITRYRWFLSDLRRFQDLGGRVRLSDLYPMLEDRGEHPVDMHYVTQAHWATSRVLDRAPHHHVDVASQTEFVAMLAAHVPVTTVDVRPLDLGLPNLEVRVGNVTALPYPAGSVPSLSCLHVLEHVGLGRYGDDIDPAGTEAGATELARVLAPDGTLLVSLPIGAPRVEFNAHRVHSVAGVIELFPELHLESLSVVDDDGQLHWDASPEDPRWQSLAYGCGMFEFRQLTSGGISG